MNIKDSTCNHLVFPVTWDAAHALNLAVLDIKDSQTEGREHMNRFIQRCNVFHTLLARGKGFAFLQAVGSNARRPVLNATQRFASSANEQWLKIEQSFNSYWQAFDVLYSKRKEEEEYQYMIAGSDFVAGLLAFIDTLEPIVDLMLHVQSLDTPILKLKRWWPILKEQMLALSAGYPDSLPRYSKRKDAIFPGGAYKSIAAKCLIG